MSHVIPVQRTFDFDSAEEFEAKPRDIAILWAPMLSGKSFHVRLHRRDLKGKLSTAKEERFLDDMLLDALDALGAPGRVGSYRSKSLMVALDWRCGTARISGVTAFSGCHEGAAATLPETVLPAGPCGTIYSCKQ